MKFVRVKEYQLNAVELEVHSQGRSPRKESQRGLIDAHSQACSQGERSPRKESQRGLRDAHSQTCSQGRRSKKKATRLQRI